jgi:hypothetical protein
MQQQLIQQPQVQPMAGQIPGLDEPHLYPGSYTVQPAQPPYTTAQVASPELVAAAQQAAGYGYGFPGAASQQAVMPTSPQGAYRTSMLPQPTQYSQPAVYQTQPLIMSRPGSMSLAPAQAGPYYPMQ